MKDLIQNPHLEGESFIWQNGQTGILLSHGYTATTAEVRPFAKLLYEKGFTVAGPLLPGHGTRPEDLNRVSWQEWVECVETMYRRLTTVCSRVFIGGESMGGLLALYLASEHPEVCGVLAYAPALMLKMPWHKRLGLRVASLFIPYIAKPGSKMERPPSPADETWQGYRVHPLKGVGQLLRLQQAVHRRLPQVRQPILIVQGKLDPSVHPSVPALISSSVQSSIREIHWMEHSGHVVILDREMPQVAQVTLEFIQRVLEAEAHQDIKQGSAG